MHARLETKLHRPLSADDLVVRPRLLQQLDRALACKLTVVCAPAGFGKTSLVASWLAYQQHPSAWLSLDEADNTLAGFLSYVVAAVQKVAPGACEQILGLLNNPQAPSVERLAETLINDLEQVRQVFFVVLDDYHVIRDPAIHQLMAWMIRYQPQNVRLIVLTRAKPPWSLSSMRARGGQITEIRANELQFTDDETRGFLTAAAGLTLDDATLGQLQERNEGWAAGLRLVALSIKDHKRPAELIAAFQGTQRHIMGYFLDEVLKQKSQDERNCLLNSAILDRFCADACDALFAAGAQQPQMRGQAFIHWLEEMNLFVVPLDDAGTWFRYHHLFQEVLQRMLREQVSECDLTRLHLAAHDWFAKAGLVDEGVKHALLAGEPERAADLVEDNVMRAMHQESWHSLGRWLDALPEHVVETRPYLLTARVWLLYEMHVGTQKMISQLAAQVEHLMSQPPARSLRMSATGAQETALRQAWMLGSISIMRAEACLACDDAARALAQANAALMQLPKRYLSNRGSAVNLLAQASIPTGQYDAAIQWIADQLRVNIDRAENAQYSIRLLGALCQIFLSLGELRQLNDAATRMLQLCEDAGAVLSAGWARLSLGFVAYERNDLDDAMRHFTDIVNTRMQISHGLTRLALCGLAFTNQALGHAQNANAAIEMLESVDAEHAGHTLPMTRALKAHIALLQGDLDACRAWLDTLPTDVTQLIQVTAMPETVDYTRIVTLLGLGMAEDLAQAQRWLERLLPLANRGHYQRVAIRLQATQAAVYYADGQMQQARTTLAHAVQQAQSRGYVRVFLDAGPGLDEVLAQLAEQDVAPAYVAKLRAAFAATRLNYSLPSALMTPREEEVLRYFEQRLSNKEISQRLYISTQTVQRHATNIFNKLGVRSRRQAVLKARQLGILNEPASFAASLH